MKKLILAVPFAIALAFSSAASAQQEGVVNVDISVVKNDIANDLNVEVIDIDTVQVPVGVAANVCGVTANVLAKQMQDGEAECQATTTSQALNQVVKRSIGG